jgi:hypothetical protein
MGHPDRGVKAGKLESVDAAPGVAILDAIRRKSDCKATRSTRLGLLVCRSVNRSANGMGMALSLPENEVAQDGKFG